MATKTKQKYSVGNWIGHVFFLALTIIWLAPLAIVLINSFKTRTSVNREPFSIPAGETFVGWENYEEALFGYGFIDAIWWTVVITVLSVGLILLCTSMAGWYITRLKNKWTSAFYYTLVISMVVPFQMVMYTLSFVADRLGFNTPWLLPIVYLGFGAGMATFMFSGAAKSIPIEIEEAAMIDGASPLKTFFSVVAPLLKTNYITVGILQIMWIWNDFLLPYLVLNINNYKTISIIIQYMRGSYGRVDMGSTMAALVLAIIPVIIFYAFGQKYIISGVTAGAVKG